MNWLAAAFFLAKTYAVEGLVVAVRPAEQTIVVSHKEIPGVMPAMAMPVRVRDAREMRGLQPGDSVQFQLVVEEGRGSARRLRVRKPENQIEQDRRVVPLETPKEQVAVGAAFPDFALTAHDGEPWRLSDARGSLVAVQFLYTRCPMPEVCPRLAATFSRVQKRFPQAALQLVSITLDPQHDTPAVLARYATYWRAQSGWSFLTGSVEEIRRVAARFGIVYWPEEGVITHTSTLGFIDKQGRLAARVEGLNFTAQQVGDLVGKLLEEPK
ncbi:MAG: SCO family protein [Bryobacterales bacterium]|nr:SCO family protein [Bryobacterales bacterium]